MRRAGPFQYCDMHAVACMNNSMMKAHAGLLRTLKLKCPGYQRPFVCCQVETTDGESDRQRLFKVSIKWVQTISITALLTFVR